MSAVASVVSVVAAQSEVSRLLDDHRATLLNRGKLIEECEQAIYSMPVPDLEAVRAMKQFIGDVRTSNAALRELMLFLLDIKTMISMLNYKPDIATPAIRAFIEATVVMSR